MSVICLKLKTESLKAQFRTEFLEIYDVILEIFVTATQIHNNVWVT